MPDRVLLIGGTSSGKTHYGAQLLSRMQRKMGRLRFRESPTNEDIFKGVLERLGQGLSSDHTSSGAYGEVLFPASDVAGRTIDLVWPDYAGEQIEDIAQLRTLTSKWTERILQSDHWVLMVRPMLAPTGDDLLNRPLNGSELESKDGASRARPPSKQTQTIELLQILRHVKGLNNLVRTRQPKLLVLLSCWDELTQSTKVPADILAGHFPMLNAYLRANWLENQSSVYGLSALGKSLSTTVPDVEFQDRGPESFGFVIQPTGERVSDLTLPIAELAN